MPSHLSPASRCLTGACLLAAGVLSPTLHAQDLEPRAYANTPVDVHFALVGYGYSTGNVLLDAASPIEDAEITTHGMVLAYARSFEFFGDSAKFDMILPYAWASGSAVVGGVNHERDVSGLGNPAVRFSWNFIGSPAMSAVDLQHHPSDWIVGASFRTALPVGQYDEDKLLNIGTNRWAFKPELGVAKNWDKWTLEIAASATFFTDNDNFAGGNTLEKDPMFALQTHFIRSLGRGAWAGIDATYYDGGRTTVNGVSNDDRESSSRLGLTVALPLSMHQSLKFYASTGTTTRIGGDFTTVGLAWQYRWGAGMPPTSSDMHSRP